MFGVFKKVLEQKTITNEDAKKVSDFLLRRWLSGDNRLIMLANSLNLNQGKLNTKSVLIGIQKSLKGQVKFIKFPSGAKNKDSNNPDIGIIMQFFNVSETEALEYLQWFENHCPEELKTLKEICKGLK